MSGRRVLQVVLSLAPGGTERLVIELVKRLHPDFPMAVCCLDEQGAWAQELVGAGIAVTALDRQPGFRPRLGFAIAHVARQHRATVVHAHHYSPFVYSAIAKLRQPSLGLVYTEHGRLSAALPSARRRAANRALSRFPNAVFTVSDELRRHLLGEGWPASFIKVVYNGIDLDAVPDAETRRNVRDALQVQNETLVIGSVARLDPVKDLATLIRATAILAKQRRAVLAIIGDGSERETLARIATEAGIAECVRFLGHRDDARRWLAGCDVYVNSSVSEGVSLTILEAMAARLPVVATGVGGTPEILDASCGRLVPTGNPAAMATALLELASNVSLRQSLGHSGRRRVESAFTLERMIAEYADIYRTAESGAPRSNWSLH